MRAVPARDVDGCPFAGPGVDLVGDVATAILAAASPMRAWLDAREPGVALRSLSVDRRAHRVLVTLDPGPGDPRPRVVRFDPPFAEELIDLGAPVEALLDGACRTMLARRNR